MTDLPARYTNHHKPWALVRRGGSAGSKPATRMAFLVDTVVPRGAHQATAMRGYLADKAMKRWSKTMRPIPWDTVVWRWQAKPTAADIRAALGRV